MHGDKKKIVIFYATAGIGHKKAAMAIKDAFYGMNRKDVLFEDVLDYTNTFFKSSYNSVYLFLIRYLPTIWGLCYYLLDNRFVYAALRPLRRLVNRINSGPLVRFLLNKRPDAVICTHFMSVEVVSYLKKKGVLKTRLVSVITDYKAHRFWLSDYVDDYIAGADYTKEDLIRRGVPAQKILTFGIPCAGRFSTSHDADRIKSQIGLLKDKNTIFVLGGGFGIGPIRSIAYHMDRLKEDFQCIVVCGYNTKLYNEISKMAQSSAHTFKVYGFVDNVDELMAVSDLLISKPGGITVTEALASALPMIVINPIPGQEMRNYKFLERYNAALKAKSPKETVEIIKGLLVSGKLGALKENIKKIRQVNSAERIAGEIVK
ncbi:MAG: glycosyltransferase [Candidatus Omnitrophica bacterium]|nr:glycosyltransferase [Candidatus Omnitrophota bacterium]